MSNFEQTQEEVRKRISTLRVRTWTLTLALIVCIMLFCLLQIIINQKIDWITLIVVGAIQIIIYCLYFPDGDYFGSQDKSFLSNKSAYNTKANKINSEHKIEHLREYCKYDYEERKKRYFEAELGKINITEQEFEELSKLSQKEIKNLKSFEFKNEQGSKLVFFPGYKRKILFALIFKPCPIQKNSPETIMSAIENNGSSSIKDGSISYKIRSYTKIILRATVVAVFMAYIGFKISNGISLDAIIEMFFYISAIFATAIFAFSAGEKCSKVYKNNFYIELSNFIDSFNEWYEKKYGNNKMQNNNQIRLIENYTG